MANTPSPTDDDVDGDLVEIVDPRVSAAAKDLTEQLQIPEDTALKIATTANDALSEVSQNKAVFSLKDWQRIVGKLGGEGWINDPKWGSMRALIARRIGLVALSENQKDSPWAFYAPERLVKLEAEMLELAKRDTNEHLVITEELINSAFANRPSMAEEQKNATIASCTGTKAVVVTEGTAGAGKSFTLDAIREIYEQAPPRPDHPDEGVGYDLIGTALSWTATKVLEASANLKGGKAIQGLVIAMDKAKEKGEEFFKKRTILIVDEAGLVGIAHMHKLLWHAANSAYPVRVMLTGDSLQLNPVMAGNALESIVDECGSARLDTIRRQKQESHRNAVKHFCYGRAESGLWSFWQQEAIHFCVNADERREKVMQDYVRYAISFPQKSALVLALENKEVARLNDEIRDRLKSVGRLIGPEHAIKVTDGNNVFTANFCVGDQIVLRKNNQEYPVFHSRFKQLYEGAAHAQAKSEAEEKERLNNPDAQAIENSAGSTNSEDEPAKAGTSQGFFSSLNLWKKEKERAALEAQNQQNTSNATSANPNAPASSAGSTTGKASFDEQIRKGIFNRMTGLILDIRVHPDDPKHRIIRILLGEGGEIDLDTSIYVQGKSAEAKAEEEEAKKNNTPIKADPKENAVPITHNFATTVYASQGQTVDAVFMIDSPQMNRRLAYVGMSRHRDLCDVYLDCSEISDRLSREAERKRTGSFPQKSKLPPTEEELRERANICEQLRVEFSPWTPKLALRPSDYLQAVAKSWNTDSQNPTPGMAKKRMKEKKAKAQKEGENAYRPELCSDDNPEDHPDKRHEEPMVFADLVASIPPERAAAIAKSMAAEKAKKAAIAAAIAAKSSKSSNAKSGSSSASSSSTSRNSTSSSTSNSTSGKKKGFFSSFFNNKEEAAPTVSAPPPTPIAPPAPAAPEVVEAPAAFTGPTESSAPSDEKESKDTRESRDLPKWTEHVSATQALEALKGKTWQVNRYGYPRLFSIDPVKGHPRSRWGFDGALKAGDGEIPVLANEEHFNQAPWFVVQGTREALISWGHFREKHKENPHKAPNIAVAFPAANLSTLEKWVKPKSHTLYCAWSPRDIASLEKAQVLQDQLAALGHTVKMYPPAKPEHLEELQAFKEGRPYVPAEPGSVGSTSAAPTSAPAVTSSAPNPEAISVPSTVAPPAAVEEATATTATPPRSGMKP